MGKKIFLLDHNNELDEMTETLYDSEDLFQELIEKYPAILAGDQINPENPRRWIFVTREMGVPGAESGSDRWFLDHLFIDQDATPTFVEVKRSCDTRIRREVVAQMLDYAANATAYWPIERIRNFYEGTGKNLYEDIGKEEAEIEAYWQSVATNLKAGKIRLLFVADEIPDSLQRIIEFLNEQMTQTEVLGLEIRQYLSSGKRKILVPRIIGQTASAVQVKSAGRTKMNEEDILAAIEEICSRDVRVKIEEILTEIHSDQASYCDAKLVGNCINLYLQTQKMAAPAEVLQIRPNGLIVFQTGVFKYHLLKSLADEVRVDQIVKKYRNFVETALGMSGKTDISVKSMNSLIEKKQEFYDELNRLAKEIDEAILKQSGCEA